MTFTGAEDLRGMRAIQDPREIQAILKAQRKLVWRCRLGNCDPIVPSDDDPEAAASKADHLRDLHDESLCLLD